jgi:hypothetical protein
LLKEILTYPDLYKLSICKIILFFIKIIKIIKCTRGFNRYLYNLSFCGETAKLRRDAKRRAVSLEMKNKSQNSSELP